MCIKELMQPYRSDRNGNKRQGLGKNGKTKQECISGLETKTETKLQQWSIKSSSASLGGWGLGLAG